jgi:hypothetical protein
MTGLPFLQLDLLRLTERQLEAAVVLARSREIQAASDDPGIAKTALIFELI